MKDRKKEERRKSPKTFWCKGALTPSQVPNLLCIIIRIQTATKELRNDSLQAAVARIDVWSDVVVS